MRPNPPQLAPPALAPRPWPYTPWAVGVGVAIATFGTLALMHHLGQGAAAVPTPTPGPTPLPTPTPQQPPFGDDLAPWEREAELGGDVDPDGHQHATETPEPAQFVGEGHPEEHCHPVSNPNDEELICTVDPLSDPAFRPRQGKAPLAAPSPVAIWPIGPEGKHKKRLVVSYWTEQGLRGKWGRYFGATRGSRRHAGVDIFAKVGDPVRAPEDGTVIAILPFHKGTWAVYLRMAGDQVANLGEVAKKSWREFGIRPGAAVKRGDPLARVGLMEGGSHMLHYELYDGTDVDDATLIRQIRHGALRWHADQEPPARLLDPSAYLVDASARTYRTEVAQA